MSTERTSALGTASKSATWIGISLIILGVIALVAPQQSGMAIAVAVIG